MLSITQTVLPVIRQTVDNDTPLPAVVDALADVQTAIASLEALEKNLKSQLIRSGLSEVCGSSVRAVVTQIAPSQTIDYHALCDFLHPDAETVLKFAKAKAGYTKVSLYGFN